MKVELQGGRPPLHDRQPPPQAAHFGGTGDSTVIVRIMGDGQYRLDDSLAPHLAELDTATEDAYAAGDQEAHHTALASLGAVEAERRTALRRQPRVDSIVPPLDLTLEEAHKLMHGDGLVPDLEAGAS